MHTPSLRNAPLLPTTMRQAELIAAGQITLTHVPVPVPVPGTVLVRLRAVGICGSDVHYYADGRIGAAVVDFPFVLGHEPAGEVAALGDGVTGMTIGDRVALDPALPCGSCPSCLTGRRNCCPSVRFFATPPVPGAFADYRLCKPCQCFPLPDGISFEAAATLEPLAVGLHAVTLAQQRPGDRVLVVGCGPVGLLTAMCARVAGASHIVMTDPLPARRAAAAQWGADLVLDPRETDVPARLAAVMPIDVVYEAAGTQEAVDDATLSVRPGGTAVIIGIPTVDRLSLPVHQLRKREVHLVWSHRSNFAVEPAIRLMAAGAVRPEVVVTHRLPLDELGAGMEMVRHYRDGVLKAMVVFP